jgi:hypothetical protein
MAVQLINNKYSFLQFGFDTNTLATCGCDNCYLPIIQDEDIAFQVMLKTTTSLEATDLMLLDEDKFNLCLLENSTITNNATFNAAIKHNYLTDNIHFSRHQISPTEIILYWPHGIFYLTTHILLEEVFRLGLIIETGANQFIELPSNRLYRTDNKCYTSRIEYSCEENSYDFIYCNIDFKNKVRLPFYLSKPNWNDDETIYVRSDGSIKVTKSVTQKEYEGATDWMNEDFHEKFKIALSHDEVNVYSEKYTGGIRKNGKYEPNYEDTTMENLAPASFKVFATPYLVRNDNCEVCEDFVSETCGVVNGFDGLSSDNQDNTWKTTIASFTFSNTLVPGANQTIDILIRESGTTNAYISVGTVTVNHLGVLTSTPNPFVIDNIPDAWGGVQIKTVNSCGPEFIKILNSPNNCQDPTNLVLISSVPSTINNNNLDITLNFTPAAGITQYNFELEDLIGQTIVFNGNISQNGNPSTIFLANITPSDYQYRIRSICGGGIFSGFISINF